MVQIDGIPKLRVYLLTVEDPLYTHLLLQPLLASGVIEIGGVTILHPRVSFRRYLTSFVTLGPARCAVVGAAQIRPQLFRTSVAAVLKRHHIASGLVTHVTHANEASHIDRLGNSGCRVMLALNCPQRLSGAVLGQFADGVLNVHFGMLPRYRGSMPLYHALLGGESAFGVTIHVMDEQLDNGPIFAQQAVPILAGDHLPNLYTRAFGVAGPMMVEVLRHMTQGTGVEIPNEKSKASFYGLPSVGSLVNYVGMGLRTRLAFLAPQMRGK